MTRRVAIVGPGRVGGALALRLVGVGARLTGVAGRPAPGSPVVPAVRTSLQRFLDHHPGTPVRPLAEVARDADLVLLTVPDDQVEDVARALALADGVVEGQRVVHTSGRHGTGVLSSLAAAGARTAACHPAMTFPDAVRGADRLVGASWAVTAAEGDLGWARVLVTDLGGSPVTVAGGDRTLYHAGLTIGSNAATSVVTLARDVLLGAGIPDPAGFLAPLVIASAEGGAVRGVDALTGPVRRGDAGTVAAHLEELRTTFPEVVDAYVAIGHLILGHAVRAGLDPAGAAAIRDVLDAGRI